MDEKTNVFRKKTIERINSPEQLTDYLRVTNPGIWIVLAIVIVLLGSLGAWSAVGTLETKADVKVVVEDESATVLTPNGEKLESGMPLRVSDQNVTLTLVDTDEYGRSVGSAEISLPDGVYDGIVVTETVHPIDFLLKEGN